MSLKFIDRAGLFTLLERVAGEYAVLLPIAREKNQLYSEYVPSAPRASYAIGGVRAVEPMKAFYFKARQKVAEGFEDVVPSDTAKPVCLVGVKACDLKGFAILDGVFQGEDYRDPFYQSQRERSLVISADCTSALEVCFCRALQGNPYPHEGFDLNLSELEDGFVVEAGSGKGEGLIGNNGGLFREATRGQMSKRDEQRQRVTAAVDSNVQGQGIPDLASLDGLIRKNYESGLWQEEARTCVECGACNTVCPTCHCFLLFDQMREAHLARFRLWDSCLIKDFAKVAGGANPRPKLWMRLRNRFEKKFDFFPSVNGLYACTGCGRCILACPGKIDIRRVLKRNLENVQK